MDYYIGHGPRATHVEVQGVAGERSRRGEGREVVATSPAVHPSNSQPRMVGDDAAVARGRESGQRTRPVGSAASRRGRRVLLQTKGSGQPAGSGAAQTEQRQLT